jgi:hypothetical protein
VPTHQCVGRDQESCPSAPRKETAKHSQQSPIGAPITNPSVKLAFEDSDLMAEDEDLQVLIGVTPSHTDNQFKESSQAEVDKGEEHHRRSWHPGRDRGQPAEANWLVMGDDRSIGALHLTSPLDTKPRKNSPGSGMLNTTRHLTTG